MNNPDKLLKKMVEECKVINNDSKFHIHNRIESWKQHASLLKDANLEKLKNAMLMVFNEEDPLYEFEKNRRFFAQFYGKKTIYSEEIRKGLAITLALIGVYNDLLVNCSPSRRQTFAAEILNDIFVNISWQRFATLNSVLPFFAEADPDCFLSKINRMADDKKIIKDLVSDEGDILQGGYHWTGLMEALEVLAWTPEYLPRVTELLAKLTLLDNDKNIYPRPKDTLMRIFVPWYIQTTATPDELITILKDLTEKKPELVWDILISCLNTHVNTMKHRVPEIRKDFAPSIEQTSSINYEVSEKLTSEYKKIMLGMASEHIDFTKKLVQSLGIFKESPFFEEALQILSSSMVLNSSDDVKEHMYSGLGKIYCLHNRHKTDSWVMPQEKISKLLEVQMLLQPESIFFQKKHLFDRKVLDWYETNDFAAEESKYFEQHTETVKEIFSNYGLAGIFSLSHLIEVPEWLGSAVKKAGITIDNLMIKNLPTDSDEKIHYLISGYLQQCFIDKKEEWLNSFIDEEWSDNKKYMLLSCLPFTSVVWHFAEKWMYDESKYWKNINVSVIGHEPDSVYAIEKSLKYNRPDLAVNCIAWSLYFKIETDFNLCVKALKKLVELNLITKADQWHITQIIINLQGRVNNDEEKKELVLIEFLFLPLLDMSGDPKISPATLNHVLATDPTFFQEIIGFLYKSNKGIATPETSQAYFENAYRLLSQWNVVPGLNSEGNFEYSVFLKWYEKTLELCEQSGHLNIAKLHIGNVLFYVPEDKDGLWINKDIASLLNKEENNTLREGYFQETINSRSFDIVDFSGKKDFDRAKEFHDKAQLLEEFGFSNFAETLRLLEKDSKKDAERNINEGKIRNQKEEL